MSSNILHEKFYKKSFGLNTYFNNDKQLPIETRLAFFKNTVIEEHPDIICLQDLDYYNNDPFYACLKTLSPYSSLSYTLLGDKYSFGLCVAFDRSRFECIDSYSWWYSEHLDKNRGFLVVYLYDNENKKTIGLINTHLKGDYNNWDIKKQQLQEIKTYIDSNKNAAHAWIVCGDFNIHFSNRKTYEYFRTKFFPRDEHWIDTDTVMQCNKIQETPSNMTANNIIQKKQERLDYLFFTGPLIKKEYHVTPKNFLRFDGSDTKTCHYSHHGALFATFSWPKKENTQWQEMVDKVPLKYQELIDGLPVN